VRARAPLRLGFGGGGTDVAPYCDTFGGCVLNATIGMFAHCSIEVRSDQKVKFVALDYEQELETHTDSELAPTGFLALHKAVYRRIVRQFLGGACLPVTVVTYSDAPAGSGLGSSSTVVVAMIEAYRELLALPLGEYDVARLAYEIERIDVGQAGGRQDQYAATFGGINFMEFSGDQAIVNPLRIRGSTLMELEAMLVLYFTGVSRDSAKIITEQSTILRSGNGVSLDAMHQMRRDAYVMKDALLHNDLDAFSTTLGASWDAKKRTASGITNAEIKYPRCRHRRRCIVGQGVRRRRRRLPVLHRRPGAETPTVARAGSRSGNAGALLLYRGWRTGLARVTPTRRRAAHATAVRQLLSPAQKVRRSDCAPPG
jgi:D-glycero-alpha-D-manno-heptose-7-phosphate kinase